MRWKKIMPQAGFVPAGLQTPENRDFTSFFCGKTLTKKAETYINVRVQKTVVRLYRAAVINLRTSPETLW